jgi:hypothetical protein
MKTISLEKFHSLEPQTVANYLRDSRWHETEVEENHHAIWKLNHLNKTEYFVLLPLNVEIPDFPSRMYDLVRTLASIEKRSEDELFNDLDSAARIAQEQRREILNLHLYFPSDQSRPEAPARKLGCLLTALQDTLDAIGQFEMGGIKPMGRVPQEITNQTNLDVIGLFKRTFGIRLGTVPLGQLNLFEVPLAETVMDYFLTLLNSSQNEPQLRELMVRFQPRVLSRYRRFLLALADIEVSLRIEWGSQNPEKGRTAELSSVEVLQAINICDEVEMIPSEELEIFGELIAVNSEQKTFKIRDRNDRSVYFGKISDEVFESNVDLVVVKPPKLYKAMIQQALEEKTTGEVISKNKLIHLESLELQKISNPFTSPFRLLA